MPTPLSINPSFEQAKEWIFRNIEECIVAEPANLNNVPKKKGIYFWFIKPEGYKELSKFVSIGSPEPRVEKDGKHLVYIGTAGTGKDRNSHLFERLKWHINQIHSRSAICSGTISTFRAGLGALLSNDLILPNTEPELNTFLKNYFVVCWITLDDKSIDSYERSLINIIRPLFNIKLNQNVEGVNHPTRLYKKRRALILKHTRERLGCLEEKNDDLDNAEIFQGNPIGPRVLLGGAYFDLTIEVNIPKIYDANGDEYTKNKRDFFRRINNECSLNVPLHNENGNEKNTNQLGRDVINTLSKNKTSVTSYSKAKFSQSKPKLAKKSTREFKEPESVAGKTLIILNCSSSKKEGGNKILNNDFFDSFNHPNVANFRATRDSIIDHPNFYSNSINNPNDLLPAFERYCGPRSQFFKKIDWNLIRRKHSEEKLEVVIISALYGAIEYFRSIPYYNVKINSTAVLWNSSIDSAVSEYIKQKSIKNVNCFIHKDYSPLLPNIQNVGRLSFLRQAEDAHRINKLVEGIL